MAKPSSLLLHMLMIILLLIVPGEVRGVPVAEGSSCSEVMGECRIDCFAKCSLKHPGTGRWTCKASVNQTSVCVCGFPCGD